MNCLILNRLQVRNANAQPVWWMIGPPGPTAYCGFGHALARHLNILDCYLGIGPVHHDYELLADFNSPHQYRSATFIDHNDHLGKSKNKYGALSGQPTARCNLTISLILAFDKKPKINPVDLNKFLSRARVAGGTFIDLPRITQCQYEEIKLRGFGLHPRLDLMTDDPMDLLSLCHPSKRHKKAAASTNTSVTTEDGDANNSWLMPTTYGYRAITPVVENPYSRDQYPHTFVEPMVGPIQYRPVSADTPPPLWTHTNTEDLYLTNTIQTQDL